MKEWEFKMEERNIGKQKQKYLLQFFIPFIDSAHCGEGMRTAKLAL